MAISKELNLGILVNIQTGKLDANAALESGEYPFFTCSVKPLKIDFYSFDCECVLVAGNGDLNVKYYKGKFNAYQRTYVLESLDKSKLNVKYLYYFVDKNIAYLRQQAIGGIIKYIKLENLTSLKIPCFSMEKQKKIVTILDKVNALIEFQKKRLEELDNLVQSVFYEMFGDPVENEKGWKKGYIKDTVASINYGTSAPASIKGEYKYIRMNNITYSGYMDFKDLKYIDLASKIVEKYLVKKGDLLFNRTNSKELVGKTAIYSLAEPMVIAGYIIRVRVNELYDSRYIWGYLNCTHGKAYLRNLCRNIVGMANINAKEFQSIPLLLPPLSLQTRFAAIVEKIEQQKALVKKALQESEDLFQRLMQDLFRPEQENGK